jgi:hypothetical protein
MSQPVGKLLLVNNNTVDILKWFELVLEYL